MSRWQKTESGWQQTEAPLPEQTPEAAAPVLAVPTAVQLEKPEAAAPTLVVPTAGQRVLSLSLVRGDPHSRRFTLYACT